MIAGAVIQEGEQHLAFFRLGSHNATGSIEAYSILPKPMRPDVSPRFAPSVWVQLTLHEPPTTGENNENSPPADATVRLSAGDLQRVIAGLAALERQLRGAV